METEVTETTEQQDSKNFAKVRAAKEAAEARVAVLESTVKSLAVKAAGFDAGDPVVALVLEKWTPAGDEAPTPEGFAEFAKGFKLEPAATAAATAAPAVDQQLDQLQGAGDQLRQASTQPNVTPTIAERIAEAQNKGDWNTAGRLKTEALLESMKK